MNQQGLRITLSHWIFALILILMGAASLYLIFAPYRSQVYFPIQSLEPTSIQGIHAIEINTETRQLFRWTDGRAVLSLPRQGLGSHVLTLELAVPLSEVNTVTVQINGRQLYTQSLSSGLRRYSILVPGSDLRWGTNRIEVLSMSARMPGDARQLGLMLGNLRWSAGHDGWPLLPTLQMLSLLLACAALYAGLYQPGSGQRLAYTALFLLISLMMQHSDLRVERRLSAALLSTGLTLLFILAYWLQRRYAYMIPNTKTLSLKQYLLPLGIFSAMTALNFASLLPNFSSHVYGIIGDNFEYLWKIAWVRESLLDRRASALFQPDFFFPAGFDLARSELTPAHTLPGAILSLLLGTVASYNCLLLINTILSSFFTFLLAEELGASRLGAIIAGVGLGFCTYRFAYSLGTLPLNATQWVVLALYGWERFLQRQQAQDGVLCGLGIALSAWASWYYGATVPLLLLSYTIFRMPRSSLAPLLKSWPRLVPGILLAIALLAPYAQPYITLTPAAHDRKELVSLSAQPLEYLLPNPFHVIWGAELRRLTAQWGLSAYTSIGWGIVLLASVGFWQNRRRRLSWALLLVAIVWFILSLGPELRLGGQKLLLPGELIYRYMPGLKNIRIWSRMTLYVQIMLVLLASQALTPTSQLAKANWQRYALLALAGIVVIESISIAPVQSATAPRPVEQWLAGQVRRPVLHIPDTASGWHEFQSLTTQQPLVAGYGTFYPAAFTSDLIALQDFPDQRSLDAIVHLQAGYVVVNQALLDATKPEWRSILEQQPGFRELYRDSEVTVYAFDVYAR